MSVTGGNRFRTAAVLVWLPVVIALGCASEQAAEPSEELYQRDLSEGLHNLTPVRGIRGKLSLHMDGDAFECSMCHEGFAGDLGEAALEGQHADITFDHGRNLLCLNCHHPENADVYVDHGGGEIPGDAPTLLCAKCHGPHYREWEHDVHGRVNLYWDGAYGEQQKLACIQCHDPHRPKFPEMTPEPAPVLTRFQHQGAGDSSHDAG
jgi:hypothetical protein